MSEGKVDGRGEGGFASKRRTQKGEAVHLLLVLGFEVNGRPVVQGAVNAFTIIEGFDVIEDGQAGLVAGLELGAVEEFDFQGAPE